MKTFKVSDLMVPLSEYASVPENATLYEAVCELEKAQAAFDHSRYRHRAVLVYDKLGHIVGKISQLDILRALEPKYDEMLDREGLHHFGFSRKFMQSMLAHYQLWTKPLEDICREAGEKTVGQFMHTPREGEFVEESAGMDEAIHQLVLGHHQSLLATRGREIVGILRLTDVFGAIFHTMKQCHRTG